MNIDNVSCPSESLSRRRARRSSMVQCRVLLKWHRLGADDQLSAAVLPMAHLPPER